MNKSKVLFVAVLTALITGCSNNVDSPTLTHSQFRAPAEATSGAQAQPATSAQPAVPAGIQAQAQAAAAGQCDIWIRDKCKNFPSWSDMNGPDPVPSSGSSASPSACYARAVDFSATCGNHPEVWATYYRADAVSNKTFVGYKIGFSGPPKCQISIQGSCANIPGWSNFYGVDPILTSGSSANPSACYARAYDFSATCGNHPVVTATYQEPNNPYVGSKVTFSGPSKCQISIHGKCNKIPTWSNFYGLDPIPTSGSSGSSSACHARAYDFSATCGNSPYVTATYQEPNNPYGVAKVSVAGPPQCRIHIVGTCNAVPAWSFFDGPDPIANSGSALSKSVCAARAMDFSATCGNQPYVEATYFNGR